MVTPLPDIPDGQVTVGWTTFISGTTAVIGGVIGAIVTAVTGAWRVRGVLADLDQKDKDAAHAILALEKRLTEMEDELKNQEQRNEVRHSENSNAIHRLANKLQTMPDTARIDRLEDRMLAALSQALRVQLPKGAGAAE